MHTLSTHQSPTRIALFGGSFDPPHCGHLAIARAACEALALDRVLFAPVGMQPLKLHGSSASFAERVAMTELAIANDSAFALSLLDAPQPEGRPNYTWNTLERLRAELPQNAELFCLIGADSFAGMRSWYRGSELPFVVKLIVAARPGLSLQDLAASLPAGLSLITPAPATEHANGVEDRAGKRSSALLTLGIQDRAGRVAECYLLPHLAYEISATEIRLALLRNSANSSAAELDRVRELLPSSVIEYIHSHNLYHS